MGGFKPGVEFRQDLIEKATDVLRQELGVVFVLGH
jgi:hypothetical protein